MCLFGESPQIVHLIDLELVDAGHDLEFVADGVVGRVVGGAKGTVSGRADEHSNGMEIASWSDNRLSTEMTSRMAMIRLERNRVPDRCRTTRLDSAP